MNSIEADLDDLLEEGTYVGNNDLQQAHLFFFNKDKLSNRNVSGLSDNRNFFQPLLEGPKHLQLN